MINFFPIRLFSIVLLCAIGVPGPAQTQPPAPRTPAMAELPLTVASYNIRRGMGTDNQTDLQRTIATIRSFNADVVGLQEVDQGVSRSGGVDQAAVLGESLEMHSAFGAFMDYGGGKYGMAILSRHPIIKVNSLALPKGNEPRIALAAEVRLPNQQSMMVVNVHFDWVDDDTYRFAQATFLRDYLRGLDMPYVLLGDFNDQPESRTLALFREIAVEVDKSGEQEQTWPAEAPEVEIDFIFVAPEARWRRSPATVVAETLSSDHRPVVAQLQYLSSPDAR